MSLKTMDKAPLAACFGKDARIPWKFGGGGELSAHLPASVVSWSVLLKCLHCVRMTIRGLPLELALIMLVTTIDSQGLASCACHPHRSSSPLGSQLGSLAAAILLACGL